MSDVVLVAIVAAIPGTLSAVISIWNHQKIQEVHLAVNSRLTQLLELTASASHAEGEKSGAQQRRNTDTQEEK